MDVSPLRCGASDFANFRRSVHVPQYRRALKFEVLLPAQGSRSAPSPTCPIGRENASTISTCSTSGAPESQRASKIESPRICARTALEKIGKTRGKDMLADMIIGEIRLEIEHFCGLGSRVIDQAPPRARCRAGS
jgi:hypothetical protein